MVFELHIWGPAFGLPSIDPECIAAVAYLNRIVPREQWTLIANYDTAISPQDEFPLLLNGGARTSGYANIVSYLRNHNSGAYDLDHHLNHQQQTDKSAFLTFLQSTAGPLVDLYLYVSSENYSSATSSAYTAILPWYANYTIPPKRRDLARARTAHLGLSSLDVSEAGQDTRGPGSGTASSEYEAAKRAAGLPTDSQPKVLSMGRGKGLGGLLSSPIYAARFKLDAFSNELLGPLSDLLGKKDYLLEGSTPSSLDCLAFGYLALLLYPPVPQAWLKETIQTKYPRISRYLRRLRDELVGDQDINAADVWSISTTRAAVPTASLQLPWRARNHRALTSHLGAATCEILGGVPLLSLISRRLRHSPLVQDDRRVEGYSNGIPSSLPGPLLIHTIASFLGAAATGLVGLAVVHRRSPRAGPLLFQALRPQTGFNGVGDAENFLSVFANQLPRAGSL